MTPDMVWAAFTLGCWCVCWWCDRSVPCSARPAAFWSVWIVAWYIPVMLAGQFASMSIGAGFAGWFAYLAWKRRPPRKRKPSKVAARIKDLGHRLVLVPAGGAS